MGASSRRGLNIRGAGDKHQELDRERNPAQPTDQRTQGSTRNEKGASLRVVRSGYLLVRLQYAVGAPIEPGSREQVKKGPNGNQTQEKSIWPGISHVTCDGDCLACLFWQSYCLARMTGAGQSRPKSSLAREKMGKPMMNMVMAPMLAKQLAPHSGRR